MPNPENLHPEIRRPNMVPDLRKRGYPVDRMTPEEIKTTWTEIFATRRKAPQPPKP